MSSASLNRFHRGSILVGAAGASAARAHAAITAVARRHEAARAAAVFLVLMGGPSAHDDGRRSRRKANGFSRHRETPGSDGLALLADFGRRANGVADLVLED